MNYYTIKAREHERLFSKKAKEGMMLTTGNGKVNFIESITNKYVFFKTEQSKNLIKVPREKIRSAIEYLLYRRAVTREKLGDFYKFNSFLMGLLRQMFVHLSDLAKMKKSLGKRSIMRLVLKGTRFYFAGADRSPGDLAMIQQHGGRFVLFSYWNLRTDKHETWKYHIKKLGLKVLLDSGEYSMHRLRKRIDVVQDRLQTMQEGTSNWSKQISELRKLEAKSQHPVRITDYAEFILRHQSVLFDVFNLDKTGDPEESMFNLNYLYRRGIKAIPIWHPQSPMDALDTLVRDGRGFDVIAIGGLLSLKEEERHRIVNTVMERYGEHQNFHLLGCSSPLIFKGETFQCDSTGALMGRRYMTVITEHGHIKTDEVYPEQKWTEEKCLAFNIQKLSSLEDYHTTQQLEILMPPALTSEAITLF
ncbi:hypothetical protein ABER99_20430 [Paenibacillus glucanolyticus]|jgi:hypothetical protein|uniref:Uncharacterized protein n=1 Tax=Paenibacillus glucanolyticus TaxID=59843 RepID=A0A163GHQ3_9BACL|nr:hypothetical protein [Paenibacillus glucanolyticus]KZS44979.1 hypothetical protein AWU65_03085 [Paenibacillus glucanolyticus]OMF64808.1 hypothetical protein BK142_31425 [Paenibacillus glucanolyticus]